MIGRKIERLQPHRDGEQPRATLVGKCDCGFVVATLNCGVGRLCEQRPRVRDQRPRLGFVVSLAKQQQEGVASARVHRFGVVPVAVLEQHPAEKATGAHVIARIGVAGEYGEGRLVGGDGKLAIAGAQAADAPGIGIADRDLRLRPLLREGFIREHSERCFEMLERGFPVVGAITLLAIEIDDGEVVAGGRPFVRHGLAREHSESRTDMCDCLFAVVRAVTMAADAVDRAEIVLGRRPQQRLGFPSEYREHRFIVRDRHLHVGGAVAENAACLHDREVVLELCPLARRGVLREDLERRFEMSDGPFLVVGALAADARPIGDAGVIVRACPVLWIRRECEILHRVVEEDDGALQIVGPNAAWPHRVYTADAER